MTGMAPDKFDWQLGTDSYGTPVDLKEALPAPDGDPEEVDEYLAAINPSIPPRKIPNEISIDDLLGDL